MSNLEERFRGCLLGLALGDAFGAPFEGGPLEKFVWRFLGKTTGGLRRYTDDTQMTLDLAESLIEQRKLDPDDLAIRFAKSYRWSRGYGPGTARVLKKIRRGVPWQAANRAAHSEGSHGNGAAMRAPIIGLYFGLHSQELKEAARRSAEVTHAHPLGLDSAVIVATATACAINSDDALGIFDSAANAASSQVFLDQFLMARTWLLNRHASRPVEVRSTLGTGTAATKSTVTAIYLAARFLDEPIENLLTFIAEAGGDVDTVSAMAGAIWGTRNGIASLPKSMLETIEDYSRIDDVAVALYRSVPKGPPGMEIT